MPRRTAPDQGSHVRINVSLSQKALYRLTQMSKKFGLNRSQAIEDLAAAWDLAGQIPPREMARRCHEHALLAHSTDNATMAQSLRLVAETYGITEQDTLSIILANWEACVGKYPEKAFLMFEHAIAGNWHPTVTRKW